MPELPEVETLIRDLRRKILKKKIVRINVRLKKIVKSHLKRFALDLKNNKFVNIKRKGKLLIFKLTSGGKYLLIHLRMTGQLIYQKEKKIIAGGHGEPNNFDNLPNKYSHIIFYFNDGSRLFFNDQRQFGVIQLVNEREMKKIDAKFGLEPLESQFTLRKFENILKSKKGNIKTFLLNQKIIAGIGNIYADEILFSAQILPKRSTDSLSVKEIKKIYGSTKKILQKAIKYRGTTFNSFVDADGKQGKFMKLLKVYKREKKECLRCKVGTIQKTKIAGRGTRFCKTCQK